ncbi:MAG: hypothetical protein HY319_19685 [Armatimonadetes bacterium]|nr:hypothetical protein [Armatimonadota bacterium]
MKRLGTQGIGLGTVLMVVAILATLGFALAGVSVTHLRLMSHASQEMEARNLARSAVARGLERILVDADFGADRADEDTVEVAFSESPAVGLLAFDKDRAQELGIPFSTNNLEKSTAEEGAGRLVPMNGIHLVGVGRCGAVTRTVEAVFHCPPFPYALAAAGRVHSEGSLTVAGLPEDGRLDVPVEDLPPADMVSNSQDSDAVSLEAPTLITGDVHSRGQVQFDPAADVRILGTVRAGAAAVELPDLDPESFDPAALEAGYEVLAESIYSESPTVLIGGARREGSLLVTRGLQLDGALLFVDGDLTVDGGLSGLGIVAVTGDVTVRGRADLSGANHLAVVCDGSVRLSGQGSGNSFLHGLVYSEGLFAADRITVVGGLIAGGAGEDVSLSSCRVFRPKNLVPISVTLGGSGAAPAGTVFVEKSVLGVSWWNRDAEVNPGMMPLYQLDLDFDRNPPELVFTPLSSGNPPSRYALDPAVMPLLAQNPGSAPWTVEGRSIMDHLQAEIGQEVDAMDIEALWGSADNLNFLAEKSFQRMLSTYPATPPSGGSEGEPKTVTLDPSQFLNPRARLKLALWRED